MSDAFPLSATMFLFETVLLIESEAVVIEGVGCMASD